MTTQQDIAINGIQDILLNMATKELESRRRPKMAGCVLLGQHAVTIEHGTDPGEHNMLVKVSDAEVNFYLDNDGSLVITYSGNNTMGADIVGVIPPPEGKRCKVCGRLTTDYHDHEVK
jgi:hypothetical protein